MKRDLIRSLGYGDKVKGLINFYNGKYADVVWELTQDAEFMSKLDGLGFSTVRPSDIHHFVNTEVLALTEMVEEGGTLNRKGDEFALAATKSRIQTVQAMGAKWDEIVQRYLHFLGQTLDDYEMDERAAKEANMALPDGKKKPMPALPHDAMNATRKAFLASVMAVQELMEDRHVQAVVRAANVNVQNGMSQSDFFDIVLNDLAPQLKVDHQVMMEALTKALIGNKRRGKTIDAAAFVAERKPFVAAISKDLFPGSAGGPTP